jgi:hypothetical protein
LHHQAATGHPIGRTPTKRIDITLKHPLRKYVMFYCGCPSQVVKKSVHFWGISEKEVKEIFSPTVHLE